jgi:hypothetical protein
LSKRLGIARADQIDPLLVDADEVGRMLHGLISRLNQQADP